MTVEEGKLIAEVLTPIAVLLLGILVHRMTSRLESRQTLNQKLVEARLDVFSRLSPAVNQTYCYFMRIGVWKDLSPAAVIKLKRDADGIMFPFFPLFNETTYRAYADLYELLFRTYSGKGQDARLLLDASDYNVEGVHWEEEWEPLFEKPQVTEEKRRRDVHDRYVALMRAFATQLGIESTDQWAPTLPSARSRPMKAVSLGTTAPTA